MRVYRILFFMYGLFLVLLMGGDVNFLVERMVAPSSCHYAATGI